MVVAVVALVDVGQRVAAAQSRWLARGPKSASAGSKSAPGGGLLASFAPDDWACALSWFVYGVVALGLAAPQLSVFLDRVAGGHSGSRGFVRVRPLWRWTGDNPLVLWFRGLGLFVPLFTLAAAMFVPAAGRHTTRLSFYLGFAVVFVVANFVMFQPWEMDNTKVRSPRRWVPGAGMSVSRVCWRP
jgi:hypothetical protein